MSTTLTSLRVPGLGKRKTAKLVAIAKSRGLTPGLYIKEVLEDQLEIEEAARTMTFDEILAPLRKSLGRIDEEELDRLVDQARTRHHNRRAARKK